MVTPIKSFCGGKLRRQSRTKGDHFIKNPAFSAAKMTDDERGLIVYDCQKIVFGRRKRCLSLNCSAFVDFIF